VVDDTNMKKLIQAADNVEEAYARNGHRTSDITAVTAQQTQNVGVSDPTASAINA
jgi:hypothetical protein